MRQFKGTVNPLLSEMKGTWCYADSSDESYFF